MYALERWVRLNTGYRWARYAVSANGLLLHRVRMGQPNPEEYRIVSMAFSLENECRGLARSA